jgi:hypothetical protein
VVRTVAEEAVARRVTIGAVRKWIREGGRSFLIPAGRCCRLDPDLLDEWLRQRTERQRQARVERRLAKKAETLNEHAAAAIEQ